MYYGFDIGGTKIEFGAFDEDLNRVATERFPTPQESYGKFLESIVNVIERHDINYGLNGKVGLGIPGVEQCVTGEVMTPNIPKLNGRRLRKDLEEILGMSIALENDANCFAVSEAYDTEMRVHDTVLGLIMGTGFGGGLVHGGRVISGPNGTTGEVGHMRLTIDAYEILGDNPPNFHCGCGKTNCLDQYLSGRGFERLYKFYYDEELSAPEIHERYKACDMKALEHVDRFCELTAICFANIFNLFDPDVVVLGGGLSNFDPLYRELPARISHHILRNSHPPKIVRAKYGDSGGVRGAAFLNIT